MDEFYHNHPLTFLGRDPSKVQLTNLPSSIAEARTQILKGSWDNPETDLDEKAVCFAEQLYLFATGNYTFPSQYVTDRSISRSEIRRLIESKRINKSNCGLISDLETKKRLDVLSGDELDKSSIHELSRFCFSPGMYIGHDMELHELKAMAQWIIRNENDGVTFSNFSGMMQQAIDMSVFAQYAANLGPESDPTCRSRLSNLADKNIALTDKMNEKMSDIQHRTGLLFKAAEEAAERKPVSDFQARVLRSHAEYQMQNEGRMEKAQSQPIDDELESVNNSQETQ